MLDDLDPGRVEELGVLPDRFERPDAHPAMPEGVWSGEARGVGEDVVSVLWVGVPHVDMVVFRAGKGNGGRVPAVTVRGQYGQTAPDVGQLLQDHVAPGAPE